MKKVFFTGAPGIAAPQDRRPARAAGLPLILVFLASCGQAPVQTAYLVQFPEVPPLWREILGPPCWKLEWLPPDGAWAVRDGAEGSGAFSLSFREEWTSPVLAWPYWPEKGLHPGRMRPAGALFPWDVSGGSVSLSWEAGVDAVFWRELAVTGARSTASGANRVPWLFDWPGFRELMAGEDIAPEVRRDPWLADWNAIALKTAESGFSKGRLKPGEGAWLSVPFPGTVWAGSSPFSDHVKAGPLEFPRLWAGNTPQTWISQAGMLRCQLDAWVFIPWQGR